MDMIGNYKFAKIDHPCHGIDRQFSVISHGGRNGVAIWDDGLRSDPFTVRTTSYHLDYLAARQFASQAKALEDGPPVTMEVGGVSEAGVMYQVVRVNPIQVRRLVLGRGPSGLYGGRTMLEITLQPV